MSERHILNLKYPQLDYPDWQRSVFDALIELDWESIHEKIRIAELAILTRLQGTEPISESEKLALHNGLSSLSLLIQRRKLQGKNSSREKAS